MDKKNPVHVWPYTHLFLIWWDLSCVLYWVPHSLLSESSLPRLHMHNTTSISVHHWGLGWAKSHFAGFAICLDWLSTILIKKFTLTSFELPLFAVSKNYFCCWPYFSVLCCNPEQLKFLHVLQYGSDPWLGFPSAITFFDLRVQFLLYTWVFGWVQLP